jgi:hypothetical protein
MVTWAKPEARAVYPSHLSRIAHRGRGIGYRGRGGTMRSGHRRVCLAGIVGSTASIGWSVQPASAPSSARCIWLVDA